MALLQRSGPRRRDCQRVPHAVFRQRFLGQPVDATRQVFTPVGQGGGSCDDGNPCTIDGCDAGSGLCTHTAGNDGMTCEVNHTCGKCSAGVCGENLLSGSDEFNSTTLGSQWSIVNQDAANWSLSAVPGSLQITALDGDVWGGNNSAKNVFAQAAPTATSYELITRADFNPGKNDQNAGILLWKDFDNWVWLPVLFVVHAGRADRVAGSRDQLHWELGRHRKRVLDHHLPEVGGHWWPGYWLLQL